MKSARRHELRTNVLADRLGRIIVRLKPHSRILSYAALVILAVVFVLVIWPRIQGTPSTEDVPREAFSRAQMSLAAEPVREFLRIYPDSPQAPTARLILADRLLRQVDLGTDLGEGEEGRAKAARLLTEAKELYKKVAETGGREEAMARVGLALVAIQEGDLETGQKALETVRQKWPESIAAAKAKVHLDALADWEPVAFSNEPLQAEENTAPPAGGGSHEPPEGERAPKG